MKKSYIVLICIVLVVLAIGGLFGGSYNKMVEMSESVESSSADLDTMLQRRADLVPNLVNTVKGFTNHETEIIDSITEARAKLVGAKSLEEKSEANGELTTALNALNVVVENYPELKSSENYIQLSDELAGTENRIAVARKDYNEAVKSYNSSIKRFPNNILAGMFGFEEKEYFEASEGSEEVPVVDFN